MTLALWNIDHPAATSTRIIAIQRLILELGCDHVILTETNAALNLPGYTVALPAPSPFINRSRDYRPPNHYYQVGVYSRHGLHSPKKGSEVNGVYAEATTIPALHLYGSLFTIKDRWAAWSDRRYTDRVEEQCAAIRQWAGPRFIAGGDFNFRGQGSYNRIGRERLAQTVADAALVWPTQQEERTVQHLVHSSDLRTNRYQLFTTGLSDHPVLVFELIPAQK